MSAFCFVNILEITDPDKMEQYRCRVAETVANHGGQYRLIGGQMIVKEGDWKPEFPVIIEFPDMESAEAWYNSPEYQAILDLRLSSTRGHLVFMETPGM